MFDSDDENAETFTGSTAAPEHLIPPTFNANRPLPPLQPWQLTNQRPPSTQRSQPRNNTHVQPRHVPWEQNRNIYIPEADEDPFYRFPDAIKLNGFIITNEISRLRHQDYSFMVFCQEDQSIYGIPRRLTTPPYGIKLNEEQRWRKKRDLEFGRKVDFVLGRFRGISAVEEYAKGPADSIIAENVEGKNCFEVQCVLDSNLMRFYCLEFGESILPRPLAYHIENLAYDCKVTFDEELAIQRTPYFEIFKVVKASAEQSIICATPWVRNLPTPMISDNDIEEMKNPDNYKANVTGIRYANDRVLHLRAENNVKIIFCTDFENLPPIGSIFQFDYVFHPVKKLAVVAAVLRINDHLDTTAMQNGRDDESDFMFKMTLNIAEEKNGFFHDEILGIITDTKGCLRFSPYCQVQRPTDYINVRIKACLKQPALFDIVEICEDSHETIKACEPPFVEAIAIMINKKSGKVFAGEYPGLDLRVDENACQRFNIGEYIKGRFCLNNPDDFSDNRYYCSNATRVKTEPLPNLPIADDYALVVSKIKKIIYTAPVSNKQIKKNPQKEDVEHFSEYNFFLQNYFEAKDIGLIAGTKGRVSGAVDDIAYAILETCPDGEQCAFNYVSKYDAQHPLDLDQNKKLKEHVMRVIEGSQSGHREHHHHHRSPSISTASLTSHESLSSSSIIIPPYDNGDEISSRTTTPMAGDGRYSEMSTQSMNSSYLQSERIHSQEAAFEYDDRNSQNDDRYSFQDDERYSQNGYGSERGGDFQMSNNDQYERGNSRLSYDSVHSSAYPLQPSSAVGRPDYGRLDIQQQAPRRPRHRYDLPPDASRLPPNGGRASAQPSSGIRVESRPDSSNSAPPLRNSDSHSSGASSVTGLYANGNIRNEPRSPSPIYLEPPRPPSSSLSWASRVNSAASNNRRNEAPPQSPSAASTRPPSVASSVHLQNGYGHHGSQILTAQREPFPQSGEPRYRNMVLYERSEYISRRLASILDQMDSYLTNPVPKIRESIKMERSAETMRKMPEFEALVDRLLK